MRKDAGVGAVWVIIVVGLTVVMIPVAVIANIRLKEVERTLEDLKAYREKLKVQESQLKGELKKYTEGTGYNLVGESLPEKEVAEDRNKRRSEVFPYSPADKDLKPIDDLATVVSRTEYGSRIVDLFQFAMAQLLKGKVRFDHISFDRKLWSTRLEMAKQFAAKPPLQFPDLKPTILRKINTWRQELQARIADEQQRHQLRVQDINQEMQKHKTAIEERATDHARKLLQYQRALDTARHDFERLMRTREPVFFHITWPHIQGHLLVPTGSQRLGGIDIGSKHRVVPGMRFMVAKPGVRNSFTYKGIIEVRKTFLTYSEVEILKVFDVNSPLLDGDLIVQPFLNRSRPLKIAFAGAERPPGFRLTILQAKNRIIEWGNVVAEPISLGGEAPRKLLNVDVDFLIFTDLEPEQKEKPSEYWSAVDLGIPIAEGDMARQLYRFLE